MSDSELVSLSLFPATPDQKYATLQRSYAHWGVKRELAEEQFFARTHRLDSEEHAADGKKTSWVLAPRNDPTTLDFKCACDTFRRKVLVKQAGSTTVEELVAYAVASVFTPSENRGKGYARHMMSLLHWVLTKDRSLLPSFPEFWGTSPPELEQKGDAQCSVLYSDIGDFYGTAGPNGNHDGWTIRDPMSTIWPVPKDVPEIPGEGAIQWLDEDALNAVWKMDADQIQVDLSNSRSDKTLFSFLPDGGLGMIQVRRTPCFLHQTLHTKPTKWGVSLPLENTPGMPTFATWTVDIAAQPPTMVVTRLRATVDTFTRLVSCLSAAARECGMERIEVWNLPAELRNILARCADSKTGRRDEELSAFRWYGPEKSDDVEWFFNEKFCWG